MDEVFAHYAMTVEEYRHERVAELGEFLGTVIAEIYHGICEGELDNLSHFADAAGREHQSWESFFENIKRKNNSQPNGGSR